VEDTAHPLRDKLPLPLMASISALSALSIDMYLPAFPSMAESLGVPISSIQYSISVYLVAFGIGMLLFGPLSDRFGRRPLAIFGLSGYALASAGLALSPTVSIFLMCRFFQGVLGSAATVVVPAIIRDCFGKDTAKGMSTVTMIMLTAPLVAPVLGSVLLTFTSWRAIFAVLSIYGAATLSFVIMKLPETLPTTVGSKRLSYIGNYLAIMATPGIYRYLGTFLMSSLAFFTYLTSAPFVYITWFGVSEFVFGLLFTTTAASLILANYINVKLVSGYGSRRMMYCGLASALVFSVLLAMVTLLTNNLVLTVASFFMIIGSLGIISVNAESLVLIEFPNQASSAGAVTRTLRFSTGALVGPILALFYTGTPAPVVLLILVAIMVGAFIQLLLYLLAKRVSNHH
jgi:DHA1 family bicyclomycin/chloramphenicol resistance-like MFS transporter